MKSSSVKWISFKVTLLLTGVVLVFNACRPGPAITLPTRTPGTPGSTETSPTAPAALKFNGLSVVDDGAPLPPTIIEQQPQGGEELPVDGSIILVFDQPMDEEKTAAALSLSGPDGASVPGKINWTETRKLTFTPHSRLESGTTYHATLTTQAASAAGVALTDPLSFEFATVGNLQISQVFPAPGTQDVASSAVITVIFNRPVVPLVIAEEQANLPQPLIFSPKVEGMGEWVNTSVYAFRPAQALKGDTTYTLSVLAGLKDASDETILATDFSWSFSTASPAIDSFELSSGRVNPEDNFQNLLLDDTFIVRFLQPMDPASVDSAISLASRAGQKESVVTAWNNDATAVVITPTQRLAPNTDYIFKVSTLAHSASGGMLRQGLTWNFKTIPFPAILITRPQNNGILENFNREFFIKFASPMRIDTVKERIVITPKPDETVDWWYNEYDWSLSGYFLKPSTRYEIKLLAGMEDIYGNKTSRETVVRFTTPAYSPSASLALPYDIPVFRAFGPPESQQFYAYYTNVSQVSFTLASLTATQFANFLNGNSNAYQYNPDSGTFIWTNQAKSTGGPNERVLKSFHPATKNGDSLTPGFYFLGLDSPDVPHPESPFVDQRQLVVASANLTFKSSTTDGLVWLTDMESGKPLPGIPITIYDKNFSPIGSGTTDRDGSLYLKLPPPKDPYEARFAIAQQDKVFGFASTQWGSGGSLQNFGIWSSYYAPANQPTAYIYTERPLYRPGQPVYFKGIVRLDDDLDYRLPEKNKVKVRISSYKEKVYEEDLDLSSFGSFDGKLLLDPEAELGYYTIEASFPGSDQTIGSLTFNVAEYRKPEFQVKVTASPANILGGDSFMANVQADYYSGGGVANSQVNWTLTAEPFYFNPPDDYTNYNFTDTNEDVYENPDNVDTGSKVISEGQGTTDASGKLSLSLPADLSDSKTSRKLTFEATITDLAQTAVSGRASVVAHLSGVYPGIKPHAYIGREGEEQSFDLVALDWDGNPLAGQALTVDIVERHWYSVQQQDASGRVTWTSSVEEIPFESYTDLVTDVKGKTTVSFTPTKGGIYRARVTALDGHGKPGKASAYLWVAGKDYIPWQQTNDRSFELVTDKKSYTPGDKASILIASPFQGQAYALVTVERGKLRRQEVVLLTNNSTVYELPITPDMAPNAFISVLVVKGVDTTNPRPNFKMGIKEIKVNPEQQALQVQIQTDRSVAGPGDQVSFNIKTLDHNGSPVSAEVSLGLSDLATLSLLPPNSTPILNFFYSERTLGVWTSVPLALSVDDYNAEIQKNLPAGDFQGSGGGKGEGDLGVVEVRQDFPDTAYWDARVVTGSNGEANVAVTLPDNLTTWRMEARAVTSNTQVGQASLDVVSTKPLLVRPQTPRFFVVNDQARLGTAVHNNSNQSLTVDVALLAQGLTLQSPVTQTVEIPAHQQAYVTWKVQVDAQAERVDLIFSAASGEYKDASRPPQGTLDNQGIPVLRYEAPETVGTSGQLTSEGTRVEAINLPTTMAASSGKLTIQVSPSLAAGMTDSLTYLEHFPYECVEQTISRFLPNVISTRALKAAGIQDNALETSLSSQVATALQRLYAWQNPDGGWGWWSGDKSDPLTSAYVVLGIIEAENAGYTVDEAVSGRGLNFLRTQVVFIQGLTDPQVINRQAFILYVLARNGTPDVSSSVQLYDQHQRMALYSRAFLAQTLYTIDSSDPRLSTLLSDFASQAVLSATGAHWEEKAIDRWNWNTDTRTTAIILSTLSQLDSKNPLNANAVRWLMSSRVNGHWKGTQETAWTLMALTNWMVASGELNANYQYAVALNGEKLGDGTATPENLRKSLELQVDITKLLKDQANRLAFARDDGPGNLYYTAHLNVSLPVEQTRPLDRGVAVSRSYYTLDNLNSPIDSAKVGDLLLARVTIVAPYALHYLMVDDPLPAGLEAVDQSLNTSPQSVEVPQQYSWQDIFWRGWGWWYFSHVQKRDEKVILSTSYLPAGTYIYTYLVRAGTAGVFRVIPTTAQEFYFPEVYGRGAGSLFTVTP
jgi:alpha-2-macroglobulin